MKNLLLERVLRDNKKISDICDEDERQDLMIGSLPIDIRFKDMRDEVQKS